MDAKWLNAQFDKNPSKSKGDLSEILGIQASGISKMLAGTRQIKAREYMLMRKFFDMAGSGDSLIRKDKNIPSYDNLKAEDSGRQSWEAARSNYNVIEIADTAMMPDFLPGERVLIDASAKLSERPGIFALEEKGFVIIRIVEQATTSKIKLSSIAKDIAPKTVAANSVKILGKVIAKLNWL